MKLTENHLKLVVIGIGVLFIVYGILRKVLNFNVDEALEKNVVTALFVLAAVLFLYGRNLRKKEQSENKDKKDK